MKTSTITSKTLETFYFGVDVVKKEFSSIAGGNVGWLDHFGKRYGSFTKELPF